MKKAFTERLINVTPSTVFPVCRFENKAQSINFAAMVILLVGLCMAMLLAILNRRLNYTVFKDVMRQTLNTSGYIVGIFIAANFFAYVLRGYGGDEIVEHMVGNSFENPYMVVVFILFIV